jgi:hypothetical protein
VFLVHLVLGVLARNSLVSIKILDIDRPCPRLPDGPQVVRKLNLLVKREIDQTWDHTLVDYKIFNDTRQVAYQILVVIPNGKFS